MLIAVGVGGASASASDAPGPSVTAAAVTITTPDGVPITTPAAQVPGNQRALLTDWNSTVDQPVAHVDAASSQASSTRKSSVARVEISGLSLFGGELTADSLTFVASLAAGAAQGDLTAPQQLVVDGTPLVLPAAGADPLPLGDWGQISTTVTLKDTTGIEVVGLRLELLADHGGLPAGSEIRIATASFPPPPPLESPTPTGGGQTTAPPPTLTPQQPKHHRHHPVHTQSAGHKRTHHHRSHPVVHPSHLPRLGRGVRARVVAAAADQIGWPYLWGGESRSEGGFDCSGLVDYAYTAAGHPFPGRPTAAVLWRMGIPIHRDQLRPGDLVFLGAPSGEPYHVALYAGDGMVIVASGRGRPIAAVPLSDAPWDGFARVWAAGSITLQRAPWLTAVVVSSQLDRQADVAAARRAADVAAAPHADFTDQPVESSTPAPAPPRPRRDAPTATVADVRARVSLGRSVGPLPSR